MPRQTPPPDYPMPEGYKELRTVGDNRLVGYTCVECGRLDTAPHLPTCSKATPAQLDLLLREVERLKEENARLAETPGLEIWLCPVHEALDKHDKLDPMDNCVACIRAERNNLRSELAAAQQRAELAERKARALDWLISKTLPAPDGVELFTYQGGEARVKYNKGDKEIIVGNNEMSMLETIESAS